MSGEGPWIVGFAWVFDLPMGGERFAYDDRSGRVERLDQQAAVDVWVCYRVDEPWTWRVKPGQRAGVCADCGAPIVYRITDTSPTDPAVRKVCTYCVALRIATFEGTR